MHRQLISENELTARFDSRNFSSRWSERYMDAFLDAFLESYTNKYINTHLVMSPKTCGSSWSVIGEDRAQQSGKPKRILMIIPKYFAPFLSLRGASTQTHTGTCCLWRHYKGFPDFTRVTKTSKTTWEYLHCEISGNRGFEQAREFGYFEFHSYNGSWQLGEGEQKIKENNKII